MEQQDTAAVKLLSQAVYIYIWSIISDDEVGQEVLPYLASFSHVWCLQMETARQRVAFELQDMDLELDPKQILTIDSSL